MAEAEPSADERSFRLLVIATGFCWSAAFVVIALYFQLGLYGDGAMFSYAVAVQDAWAFHWHNVSGRTSVYLLTLLPAELLVAITGNPRVGILAYSFLFYSAPLAGLAATYAADHSQGRLIFLYACGSTALLCPLIFGFPTEMWLAHAIFWPALALGHYARPTTPGAILVFAVWLLLAFTHEGAFVLLLAILASLSLRGLRSITFRRGVVNLFLIAALAAATKLCLPPDSYFAGAFVRAALHFFTPAIFRVEIVIELMAAIIGFAAIHRLTARWSPRVACIVALSITIILLCIFWLGIDDSVHASNRYYLRTAVVVVTPLLGMMAGFAATKQDGSVATPPSHLEQFFNRSIRSFCALSSMLFVVSLIHIVETGKFVTAWSRYRDAIAKLAISEDSDPAIGDARFVSSKRIPTDLASLEWFSTVPYLSVILANFQPNRLVIDPSGNYFWLSCATATNSMARQLAVPPRVRELVRTYSCLHR